MEAIETIEQDGWTVSLYPDFDAGSPDEWDNLATFAHATDYTFGEPLGRRYDEDRREGALVRALSIFGDDVAAVLPVYIAEHGPQLSAWETDAENANAVLYTTHKRVTELCGEEPKYHSREWVTESLRGELETWRQYLEGDVYGYVVKDPSGNETDDGSLWGLYGSEYAEQEARAALDLEIAAHAERQAEIARGWALAARARMGS